MIKTKNIILLPFILLVVIVCSYQLFAFDLPIGKQTPKYTEGKIRVGVLRFYSDTLSKGQLDKIADAASRSFAFRDDVEVVEKKVRDTVLGNANLLKVNILAKPETSKKIAEFLNVDYLIYGIADIEENNMIKVRFFLYDNKSGCVMSTYEIVGFNLKGAIDQIPSVIYKFAGDMSGVDSNELVLKKKYKLTDEEWKQVKDKVQASEEEAGSPKDLTVVSNKKVEDLEKQNAQNEERIRELEKTINNLKNSKTAIPIKNTTGAIPTSPINSSIPRVQTPISLPQPVQTQKEVLSGNDSGMEPTQTNSTASVNQTAVKNTIQPGQGATSIRSQTQTAVPTETPLAIVNKPINGINAATPANPANPAVHTPAQTAQTPKTNPATSVVGVPVNDAKPSPTPAVQKAIPTATPQPKPKEVAKVVPVNTPKPVNAATPAKAAIPVNTASDIAAKNKQEAKRLYDEVAGLPNLNSQESLDKSRRAVQLDPTNINYTYTLARVYFARQDLDNATIQCLNALRLNPENEIVHTLLGSIYYEQEKFSDAAQEHKTALKYNPKNYNAQYNLALTLMKVDRNAALVEWKKYIDLAKDVPAQAEWVDKARNKYIKELEAERTGSPSSKTGEQ